MEGFAEAVRAALAALPADHGGRFGRKVFISTVCAALGGSAADVRGRLFAAHRAGLIELARADFVQAMNPALVAASELQVDGATFHFVVDAAAPDVARRQLAPL